MVTRLNRGMLWPILAIATVLILVGCSEMSPEQQALLKLLPNTGYLQGQPCDGLLKGEGNSYSWVKVVGWNKVTSALIYEYGDGGETKRRDASVRIFGNINDIIDCMQKDPAFREQLLAVATEPASDPTVAAPENVQPTTAPALEYYLVQANGQRVRYASVDEAVGAARQSNDGGLVLEVQGNSERLVKEVNPWNPPPELPDLPPMEPYFAWAGRNFRTLTEALAAAKQSYDGGEIRQMQRGEDQGLAQSMPAWSPPADLPDLQPMDSYFAWAGRNFRTLTDALAAAKESYDGGEIHGMQRGEDQGLAQSVPPWSPPAELSDLPPLESYFSWAGRNFRTLAEAVQAAKDSYEGGEIHKVQRGEDQGVVQMIPPWQKPSDLPADWKPSWRYYETEDGKHYLTLEEAKKAVGTFSWLLGGAEVKAIRRGLVSGVFRPPSWPKVILILLLALVLAPILLIGWWKRHQLKKQLARQAQKVSRRIQDLRPNAIDGEATKRIAKAGWTVGKVVLRILKAGLKLLLVFGLAYFAFYRLEEGDYITISVIALLSLAYALVHAIWVLVAVNQASQKGGRNKK